MADEAEVQQPEQDNPTLNATQRTGGATEDERLLQSPETADAVHFTDTDPWRVFRIMGEFVEGFDLLARIGPAVTIFGSARVPESDPYYAQARETARLLGQAGFGIITGGGPGIMQAANQGARDAGALSVGCNIELPFEQGINPHVDVAINFRYFFVRKTMFVKYAEAFVIFPGGFGTLDELFEALTLIQTGKVRDFPLILFGSAYWKGLLDWVRNTLLAEGKISPEDVDLVVVTDSPGECVRVIEQCYENHCTTNRRPDLRRKPGAAKGTPAEPEKHDAQ
ncbi:MAG TPA: TIGR00730 family Rossman fold protein [Longimicrobium sp.]|nr:TIGR00730 family Rossman fold protein [Longimicrobium sp.]